MTDAPDEEAAFSPVEEPTTPAPPPPAQAELRPSERTYERHPSGGERGGERRRKRGGGSGERRAETGFGDGVERAYCVACHHNLPETFPVQGRSGVAVIRPFVVARRTDTILLCDGEHAGPHLWPDGTPEPLSPPDLDH